VHWRRLPVVQRGQVTRRIQLTDGHASATIRLKVRTVAWVDLIPTAKASGGP
jgi:hypothetical protein